MEKTLVLGLGNPFRGDDGVGTAVIAALKGKDQPPNVVVLDGGTPGLETVLIWQGYQRVIIVDAADMGMLPGTWKRFLPEEAVLPVGEGAMRGTLHAAGLAEALALAEALEILPPELIFYGVQPEYTGWSTGLTEPVEAAVPALSAAISAEIEGFPFYQYPLAIGHDN
jgi:hydrogenase maturation protease